MSQRAENAFRLELYGELNDIVSAMKNLAQVELHRVAKAESFQQAAFSTTLGALAALQFHHPAIRPSQQGHRVWVLLGSERGFCGGFNEQVAREFSTVAEPADAVLVVGGRLANKIDAGANMQFFTGPSTADEVLPCLQQMLDYLFQFPLPSQLTLLHHDGQGVERLPLLPNPTLPQVAPLSSLQLNLPPADLCSELHWQCLQQGLLLYLLVSLKTENRMRLQQMEGAREHLEELSRNLKLRINALRQQEIVEEIEVILSLTGPE